MKRLVTLVVVITIALKSIAQCGSVPIATFSNTIVCNGNSTMFSDSSTTPSGTINYWSWDFGDGSALNYLQNPGYTYANAGNYIVTLIVNNSIGCADTIAQVVVVNPNPVVNFISDATLSCQPLCTYFFDASSVATGSNVAEIVFHRQERFHIVTSIPL
jgi:PKD repeat protein